MRATFWRGVRWGRNTAPRTPRWRQLQATPWAWLPALAHTTPAARASWPEPGDEVVGAADLVGAHHLEVLALHVHGGAVALRQPLVELERGQDPDGSEALGGGADVVDADLLAPHAPEHYGHHCPRGPTR